MKPPRLRNIANAALLVVLSLVSGVTAAGLSHWYDERDFHCFWVAGQIVATGGDPYDAAQYVPAIARIPPTEAEALGRCGQRLSYPPWTALALAPFGALPLPVAAALWASLGILATVLGIYWTWEIAARGRFSWPLVALLAVATEPFARNVAEGQFAAFGFALTAGAALSLSRKNDGAAGISTAALSLKPHTAVGFTAAVFVFAAFRRRWRILGASAATGVAVLGITQLLRPGWILEFVRGATDLSSSIADRATIWNLTGSWTLAVVVVALLIALVVVLIRPRRIDDAEFLGLAVCFGLVVAPYAWDHDYIVLTIPWSMTIGHARRSHPMVSAVFTASTVIVAAPVLWLLAGIAPLRGSESLSVTVPMITAVLLALAIRFEGARAR